MIRGKDENFLWGSISYPELLPGFLHLSLKNLGLATVGDRTLAEMDPGSEPTFNRRGGGAESLKTSFLQSVYWAIELNRELTSKP